MYICDVIPDVGRMAHLAYIWNATLQMAFVMSSGLHSEWAHQTYITNAAIRNVDLMTS